jgi:alpha-tubulin suppressor-like RCC1 family protein
MLYRDQRTRDFAWGGEPGEMGDALPTVDLGTGRTAKSIAVGRIHTCAILDDDTVKCWGNGDFVQLGVHVNFNTFQPGSMGDNLKRVDLGKGRRAVQLVAGADFNCALLDNNEVKCWGSNSAGQMGTRTPVRHKTPGTARGTYDPVPLGPGKVRRIYAGNEHACAQFDDRSFKCWGDDTYGQLGTSDSVNDCSVEREETPTTRKCRATPKGGVNLGMGRYAKYLVLGYAHTCAHLDDDTIKCWGSNQHGELGTGHVRDELCWPEERASVPCLRRPPKEPIRTAQGRTVKMVVSGDAQNCVLYDDSSVQCWGFNYYGQLGYGDTKDRDQLTDEFVEY